MVSVLNVPQPVAALATPSITEYKGFQPEPATNRLQLCETLTKAAEIPILAQLRRAVRERPSSHRTEATILATRRHRQHFVILQ